MSESNLSIRNRCTLLSVARSGLYYKKTKDNNNQDLCSLINTDQGIQYTSSSWTDVLKRYDILISMDGKGRWADNIWIERIWRTIKYECVNLLGVENLVELKTELSKYIWYYNNERLHSSLNYKQPAIYYKNSMVTNKNDDYFVYCLINEDLTNIKDVA